MPETDVEKAAREIVARIRGFSFRLDRLRLCLAVLAELVHSWKAPGVEPGTELEEVAEDDDPKAELAAEYDESSDDEFADSDPVGSDCP